MIRITVSDSRETQEAIRQIYGASGELVQLIVKRIRSELKKARNPQNGGNALTERLLTDWFCRDQEPSAEAVSEYLLNRDTAGVINQFAEKVCETEWGSKDLAAAFLRYRAFAVRRRDGSSSAKLEKLAPWLSRKHLDAGMFEVPEPDGSRRKLTAADPDTAPTAELCVTLAGKSREETDGLLDACKRIFNYDHFSKMYRNDVLNAIGVTVCPYCNRQYISACGARSTGDIDHFYDKSSYPFLALSLFNFVPSCQVCNSRMKGEKDFYLKKHVNPHQKGFGSDARFRVNNIEALIDRTVPPDISLNFDPEKNGDIANSEKTFHLNELYRNHQDYAKEIINKARIFSSTQLREYLNEYDGLFASPDELHRTIYGNYLEEENQGKRPLAKLTQDLLLDLSVEIPGMQGTEPLP